MIYPNWTNWNNPEISNILVLDGTITIGAVIQADAGSWGTLDDFNFYIVGDYQVTEPGDQEGEEPGNPRNPGSEEPEIEEPGTENPETDEPEEPESENPEIEKPDNEEPGIKNPGLHQLKERNRLTHFMASLFLLAILSDTLPNLKIKSSPFEAMLLEY